MKASGNNDSTIDLILIALAVLGFYLLWRSLQNLGSQVTGAFNSTLTGTENALYAPIAGLANMGSTLGSELGSTWNYLSGDMSSIADVGTNALSSVGSGISGGTDYLTQLLMGTAPTNVPGSAGETTPASDPFSYQNITGDQSPFIDPLAGFSMSPRPADSGSGPSDTTSSNDYDSYLDPGVFAGQSNGDGSLPLD